MTKKKKILTTVGLGVGIATVTTSTVVSCGDSEAKKSKDIADKKAAAAAKKQKDAKIKDQKLLSTITEAEINKAIKDQVTFNKETDAQTYSKTKLPSTIKMKKDNVEITITLNSPKADVVTGFITWEANLTTANKATLKKKGKLSGFSTKAQRDADAALAKLTPQKIMDAIKAAKSFTNADLASTYTAFPSTVTVTINNQNITVTLTKGTVSDVAGTIAWTANAEVTGKSSAAASRTGSLTGFSTKVQRDADAALAKLTPQKIMDAIKVSKSFTSADLASTYTPFPPTVTVAIDNQNITVTLTKGAVDEDAGTIAWTANAEVTGKSSAAVSRTGSLTGFSTKVQRDADAALAKLTPQKIMDAIKVSKSFTSADLASTYTPFPPTVTVAIDNQNITVTLTKGAVDEDAGTIAWTANAEVTGKSSAAVSRTGSLTGFSTKVQRDADAALAKLTPQKIMDAIKVSKSFTNADLASTYTPFPPTVTIAIDNQNITITLTKGAVDEDAGTIAWTANAEVTGKSSAAVSRTGLLTGFSTKVQRDADDTLSKLTPQEIIDAIKASKSFTDTDLASTYTPFPTTVIVAKNGMNITVTLTKGAVDEDAGTITWTASAEVTGKSSVAVSRTDSLTGFSTKVQRDADAALAKLTSTLINNAIKKSKAISNVAHASAYTPFPPTVTITIDNQNITVTLTKGVVDDNVGTITWTASAEVTGKSSITISKTGSLTGFSTKVQRDADDTLSKLTPQEIIDAIKASKSFIDTDLASTYTPFPTTVIVAKNGMNITVTLTKGAVDEDAGTIAWTASAKVTGKSSAAVSKTGSLTGFSTKVQRDADAALAKLTPQKIMDAIKVSKSFTNADLASTYTPFPPTVTITIDNQNITVTLTKGAVDEDAGTITWTASAEVTGKSSVAVSRTGLLTGFSTKVQRDADDALSNLTPQEIIDAIKASKSFTDTDLASTYTPFPTTVTVAKNGMNITVTLTKGAVDEDAGTIAWTASVEVTGKSSAAVSRTGSLTGFSTKVQRDADAALAKLTPQKIMDAIKVSKSFTNADLASTYTPFPPTVTIVIDNQNITVTLTKGAVDEDAGTITWTASAEVTGKSSVAVSKTGLLTGFSTKVQRDADDALSNLTPQEIIGAIKASKSFTDTDLASTYTPFPTTVTVAKNGMNITVTLTKGIVDEDAGTIAWTASVEVTGKSSAAVSKTGSLTGFSTKVQRDADAALAKLTPQKIMDAIKAAKGFTSVDLASTYTPFPPTVTVAIDGIDITVTLTKGTVDDNAGTIAWTASAEVTGESSAPVAKSSSLSGFSTKAQRDAIALTQKEDGVLANLTAQEIEIELRKTSSITSTTDPKTANLDVTLNFIKNGVNIKAVITKGTFNIIKGTAKWTSVISAPHATTTRTNLKGELTNLLASPIEEVKQLLNLNPTTTLTSQFANKEITKHGLADFGLTLKALGLDTLSTKISGIKITQEKYDFKNNKFNAMLTLDFQPDLKNSNKVKGTFKIVIDGFKAPKLTPADPTKISATDFKGIQLPDDFKIPATVKTIESGSFAGVKLNDNFQIPDTVTSIAGGVFKGTTLPSGFKMPKAWSKTIGNSAFAGAKLSKGFVIPATVKEIGNSSFNEATFDPKFTIPDTVEKIATTAFKHDYHKLPAGFRLPVNAKFTTITTHQFQNTILNDNFRIPANVTTLEKMAFTNTTLPIGFKVPLTVTSINFLAFWKSSVVKGAHMEDLNGNTIKWNGTSHSDMVWYAKRGIVVVADKPKTTPAPTLPDSQQNKVTYSLDDINSNILESKKIYSIK